MTSVGARILVFVIVLFPALAVAQGPSSTALERGDALMRAMEYREAFDDSLAVCREKVSAEDVAVLAAESPDTLGGVTPGDEEWPTVRNLYLDMLTKGCAYSREPAVEAFSRALAASLSEEDMDALIAFYATGLGERFRRASHAANRAGGLAAQPLPEAESAYEDYAAALGALVAS